jgi:hypothetical protein
MLALRHRLAIAGVITAAAFAVPAAAMAAGTGSPSGKPAPPPAAAASASKSAAGSQPSGKPAPPAAAAKAGKAAGAVGPQLTGLPKAASALATRLGVSAIPAQRAVKQIAGLIVQDGSVDPASAAFAAIARGLGVSPAQLAAAWNAVRQSVTVR